MASTRRPLGPARGVFDFNDIFLEGSRMDKLRNLQARSLGQMAPGQSRTLMRNQTMDEKYLMPKEGAMPGRGPTLGLRPPTISSKTRATEALRKLAQIETKILRRKQVPTALSDTESDSGTSEQRSRTTGTTNAASSQHPHRTSQKEVRKTPVAKSGESSRFLKKKEPPTEARFPEPTVGKGKRDPPPRQAEPAQRHDVPDSDEEEMKVLLGSLMESSREKETNRNQGLTSTKVSSSDLGKCISSYCEGQPGLGPEILPSQPASRSTPASSKRMPPNFQKWLLRENRDQTPAQTGVLSLLSVDHSSTKPSRPSHLPVSQSTGLGLRTGSPKTRLAGDTASLTSSPSMTNDLSKLASSQMGRIQLASSSSRSEAGLSEESVSEAEEDDDDSLHDFRINILSIDDLVPADGQKSDVEQKEEGSGREGMSGRSSPCTAPTSPEAQRVTQPDRPDSPAFQLTATTVEDKEDVATESEVSEHLAASSAWAPGSLGASSPSEEEAPSLTASLAYSEDFETSSGPLASEASPDRTLDALSQFSSRRTDLVPRRPLSGAKWGPDATRVVKETAVQTLDPAFAYQWSKAGGMAAIGPALGGTYVDPAPIASHVVSADAIEALTAYSPAALALNDMLKQQLSLTQQFIEASRHLHVSLLRSMDRDSFHYHTLEETKEYIRCHRPAPLTMEAALREVKEELQVPAAGYSEDAA